MIVKWKKELLLAIGNSAQLSQKNYKLVGFIGLVGFPLYYVIWAYLFPQPYESLFFRLLGAVLFLALVLIERWPNSLKPYLMVYWLVAVTYGLPFFFTYMLLMNGASTVWGMSCMAAILFLFLVIDSWLLILLIFFVGSSLGWLTYMVMSGVMLPPHGYFEQLPIYLFSLLSGTIFIHRKDLLRRERERVMRAIGSSMAHELRTPLQSIQSGVAGLHRYLPALLSGYKMAKEARQEVPKIRNAHLDAMGSVLKRIENEIAYSHSIIDMLLVNSGKLNIDNSRFSEISVRSSTELALRRYPFSSEEERGMVRLLSGGDFTFLGSDVIYSHVIFNLVKNALWFIRKAGKGDITIRIVADNERNCVIFRDTGAGILPEVLPYIFEQFFSTRDAGRGAGLGLPFCKMAMESFGGTIAVRTELGNFTEFHLCFRGVEDE